MRWRDQIDGHIAQVLGDASLMMVQIARARRSGSLIEFNKRARVRLQTFLAGDNGRPAAIPKHTAHWKIRRYAVRQAVTSAV
jgi:hypothetical protein